MALRRERYELPDGDFIDLDWVGEGDGPIVVVLHGLGGSSDSHYVRGVLRACVAQGWRGVLMYFRGASEEPNRLPRSYHSGDTGDLNTLIGELRRREPATKLAVIGYSLGGNVLLKWLGELGDRAPIDAAVAVSVPFDLAATVTRLDLGFARVYQQRLLRCLKWSTARKLTRMRLPVDAAGLAAIRTLREFDQRLTAPLHGFRDADDYYSRATCRPYLQHIVRPTLIVHAVDDPFMTPQVIPAVAELSSALRLELSSRGGHVGFVSGPPWRPQYWLEARIIDYLTAMLSC